MPAVMSSSCVDAGALNPGLHACAASALSLSISLARQKLLSGTQHQRLTAAAFSVS